MIRWLWSMIMKWGWDFNREGRTSRPFPTHRRDFETIGIDADTANIDLPDPVQFRVQQIIGGTLIETRWHDHKKNESRVKLHIITPEENLSDSIGKIITMELLHK